MKVIVVFSVIFFALVQSQNYVPVLLPLYNISHIGWNLTNKTQWDWTEINKTHPNIPFFNNTHWDWSAFNKTGLNQTHPNIPALNQPAPNRPALNQPALNSDSRWTYNYTTHSGDVLIGQIVFRDRLLFNKTFYKEARWWSSREKTFEYPKDLKDAYYRHEIISAIRIYNRFYDGAHSRAEIVKGGVGYRFAKIRMSSSWARGFKYELQIYGH